MEAFVYEPGSRQAIKQKLREHFDGKIVRKDLTKKIKEGANVPTYVLEFLLGQYCSSDDDAIMNPECSRSNAFWLITSCVQMKTRRFCHSCGSAEATRSST